MPVSNAQTPPPCPQPSPRSSAWSACTAGRGPFWTGGRAPPAHQARAEEEGVGCSTSQALGMRQTRQAAPSQGRGKCNTSQAGRLGVRQTQTAVPNTSLPAAREMGLGTTRVHRWPSLRAACSPPPGPHSPAATTSARAAAAACGALPRGCARACSRPATPAPPPRLRSSPAGRPGTGRRGRPRCCRQPGPGARHHPAPWQRPGLRRGHRRQTSSSCVGWRAVTAARLVGARRESACGGGGVSVSGHKAGCSLPCQGKQCSWGWQCSRCSRSAQSGMRQALLQGRTSAAWPRAAAGHRRCRRQPRMSRGAAAGCARRLRALPPAEAALPPQAQTFWAAAGGAGRRRAAAQARRWQARAGPRRWGRARGRAGCWGRGPQTGLPPLPPAGCRWRWG